MATLAADTPRWHHPTNLDVHDEVEAVAADIIYEGAAVGVNSSGYAGPLLTSSATIFVGFAREQCDNADGAAGDKRVKVLAGGLVRLPISGVTRADIGKPVYATDDNTFTLTKSSAAVLVGHVASVNIAGEPLVAIKATAHGGKAQSSIADPSGGATTDAEARTAIASIIDALEAAGITDPA